MGQANVELSAAPGEAWDRADIEGLFALYDPAIVWDQTHYGDVIGGVYRGHAQGVRNFFRAMAGTHSRLTGRMPRHLSTQATTSSWRSGKAGAGRQAVHASRCRSTGRCTESEMGSWSGSSPTDSKPRRSRRPV